MDENRWPRPGPGMVVLFAVVGLIAGILAGLFSPAGSRQGAGQAVGQPPGEASTTTRVPDLPDRFYTVILASIPRSQDRSVAEARAERFRAQGVEDARVLDPERWSSLDHNYWAVSSGVFEDKGDADAHRRELRDRFPNAYRKLVSNES
jgi:SPOR domain